MSQAVVLGQTVMMCGRSKPLLGISGTLLRALVIISPGYLTKDQLRQAVWRDDVADHTIHVAVSRLKKLCTEGSITHTNDAYRYQAESDVSLFESASLAAQEALKSGDHEKALPNFERALEIWPSDTLEYYNVSYLDARLRSLRVLRRRDKIAVIECLLARGHNMTKVERYLEELATERPESDDTDEVSVLLTLATKGTSDAHSQLQHLHRLRKGENRPMLSYQRLMQRIGEAQESTARTAQIPSIPATARRQTTTHLPAATYPQFIPRESIMNDLCEAELDEHPVAVITGLGGLENPLLPTTSRGSPLRATATTSLFGSPTEWIQVRQL